MKLNCLILLALITVAISCSSEVDLVPDDAPRMLYILGCIDGSGSTQQIKVRRLVQGEGVASEMMNDPNLYLPDQSALVVLEEPSGFRHVLLPRLYPAQTGGAISQDSNYIYEIRGFHPAPGQALKLIVEDKVNNLYSTGSLSVLRANGFQYPVPESVVHGRFVFHDPRRPFRIEYHPGPVDLWSISIKYIDVHANGDRFYRKAIFCGTPDTYETMEIRSREFSLDYLWNIFNSAIPDDPLVDYRLFYRFDFTKWTGDNNLRNYILSASRYRDNRRLSADNIENGMGLFYSVNRSKLTNLAPHVRFWPALADSAATRHLKFSSVAYDGPYVDPDSIDVNPFVNSIK